MTSNAENTSFDLEADFAALLVLQSLRTRPVISSWTSLDTNMAAMEQLSGRYFRIYECKSTELVSASNEMLSPGSAPDRTVQLLFIDPTYSSRLTKNPTHSAYTELLISDIKETVELVADLLRPGGHAVVFCSA